MNLFEHEEALLAGLTALTATHKPRLGMVSEDVPLISNLDVWINISLIKQYHQNIPREAAEQEVMAYLRRYQLENIANRRNPSLTHEQRFRVLLLRAAMVVDAVIVIDRPFTLLPELHDSDFIYESLDIIDDLYTKSFIVDYIWFKDRYRIGNGT